MSFEPLTGRDSLPGIMVPEEQESREFLLDPTHVVTKGIVIDDTSVDVGNTGKTYVLRPGLALIRGAGTGGKFVPADHASAPADSAILEAVILQHYVNMKGPKGTVEDKPAAGVIHGIVDDAKIIYVTAGYKAEIQAALKLVHFVA